MEDDSVMAEAAPTTLRLRSYQQEMLDASLERNIIVAMDTGSGKTHIAIARILTALERSDKLVWFLSPSVALSMQQADLLSSHLPAYHVRTLTGLDGVDKWTDQKLWDATLANVHVVIGTPAVLLDALTHGFVKIDQLGLCVFDEAHRTTKSHPMNSIMKLFYHPAIQQGRPVPDILGLTASPVVNSKHGSLETIESNLNAITRTPKHNREDLQAHVNAPVVTTVLYPRETIDPYAQTDGVLAGLTRATQGYEFAQDPYVLELIEQDDPRSRKEYQKVMMKRKTYCWENLRALDLRASTMQEQLGTSMAAWYVNTCIERFRDGIVSDAAIMPDLSEKERKHLSRIFDQVQSQAPVDDKADLSISQKVSQLLQILDQHGEAATRGIVFVEQRVQVTALAELLRRLPDVSHRVATFVGTSSSSKRKISVADLVAIKEQEKDLAAFRNGEKNLMIATNVLEEGIDVSACNLVICFDPPKNLVSFVQRRGRARQKESHYYLFVPDDQSNNKQWATLEAEMKKAYMDDTRQLASRLDDELALSDKVYQIPSTGAMLTLENAKAHLYHFCSVSTPASNYVDVRPEFDTEEHPGGTALTSSWSASVYLPSSVHADLRSAKSSKQWPNEETAIADAAFEAYVTLHKAGLINDNLLPRVKDYGPDVGQQHVDQPSIVQVTGRYLSHKELHTDENTSTQEWLSHQVHVWFRGESVCEIRLWLPSSQLPSLKLRLFWNKQDEYNVTIGGPDVTSEVVDHKALSLSQKCTQLLLSSVHGNRMPAHATDFPVLFTPNLDEDMSQWLADATGVREATSTDESDAIDAGLVRVKGQVGHAYILQDLQSDASSEEGAQLTVTNFPKRKDFLHMVSENNKSTAYSVKQSIPAVNCTIDNLPVKYAIFAAFVPSIMHKIETALLAIDLQTTLLREVDISDLGLVLEAVSAPSAEESRFQDSGLQRDASPEGAPAVKDSSNIIDYNRLEYLGDTILKHCTELQVMAQHTNWPESYLSLERDRIVRNSNLSKAALSAGLDKYILIKPFTGNKWRPPYLTELLAKAPETRHMSTKTLADVVEALIGAAFVDGGLPKSLTCISTLLPLERWHPPTQCFDNLLHDLHPSKSTHLALLERLVGHEFQHPTLLLEAITHVSYPYNRTGLSYERLEFLGDSVLDLIITPKLFAHRRELRHWELHRIHEALVNSHFLGYCCMAYAIEEEKFDVVVVQDKSTTTTTTTTATRHKIKPSTRRVHLHDFLKLSAQLIPHRRKALDLFQTLQPSLQESLQSGKEYPWPALVALNPPKYFCDIVEAILGALYIDTRGDLSVCEAFVSKLGILDHMDRILDEHVECFSPKERLGVVADREAVRYVNRWGEDVDGKRVFGCVVMVGDEEVVGVDGCGHRDEAEVKAAWEACRILEARGGSKEWEEEEV
ncbi:hypothetical protein M409DRAFT_16833 [Zasmidium cellare ATCC 36951]|uniref:Dicer-like protein 2 n=1 Tax=Zasmidium cellare ATCC 36951 TaxID=1080233 RepID=A0A6A6D410_ZASCE|nr:uncharacterized protein M409DRAFT_16833 [Zasmidium cellare ATCC 36951]KAF2172879.1 hypothetical protein M409DRAFT_16833 [Zasmidium cellare ATCC 36951]